MQSTTAASSGQSLGPIVQKITFTTTEVDNGFLIEIYGFPYSKKVAKTKEEAVSLISDILK